MTRRAWNTTEAERLRSIHAGFWRVVDGRIVEEIPAERVRVMEREAFLQDVKVVADRIAEDVAQQLDLPEDVKLVYVIDPPPD